MRRLCIVLALLFALPAVLVAQEKVITVQVTDPFPLPKDPDKSKPKPQPMPGKPGPVDMLPPPMSVTPPVVPQQPPSPAVPAQPTWTPGSAPPGTMPAPGTPCAIPQKTLPCCGDGTQFWLQADLLLWWIKGQSLPALVTASPPGTARADAGVLGRPGTMVLVGNENVNSDPRLGGQFTAGWWLDPCHEVGIQGDYFFVPGRQSNFISGFNGANPVARPYFDTLNNTQASQLIGFPGVLNGTVTVGANQSTFDSAGIAFRENWCCLADPCGTCYLRLDAIVGYRYFSFDEDLTIREDVVTTANMGNVAQGTRILAQDGFSTRNEFHGGEFGILGEFWIDRFIMTWQARLAVGVTSQSATINGITTNIAPDGATTRATGGLLGQVSNIGSYSRDQFTIIPRGTMTLGYQLSSSVRLSVGYDFLYWTNVVRPGNVVDLGVNPNLIPPTARQGGDRPAFVFRDSSLWVQGVTAGLEWRY